MVVEVTYDLRWFFLFLAVIYIGFGVSIMVVGADLGAGGEGTSLAQAVFVRLFTMIFGKQRQYVLIDAAARGQLFDPTDPVLALLPGPRGRMLCVLVRLILLMHGTSS